MTMDRIQDLRAMEDAVYEAVQQCIAESGENGNVKLLICPDSRDVVVCASSEQNIDLAAYEEVEWQGLVADGEPDVDAINDLVNTFVFVR